MEPDFLPEGHDDAFLHLFDVALTIVARIKARSIGPPEHQEFGSQTEIHCSPADLAALEQRRNHEPPRKV